LIIIVSLIGFLLLGCCGAGAVVVAPFIGEYPATVDTPAHLAGLDKVPNAQVDQLGQQLADQLKNTTNADGAVAGLYALGADESHLVLVVGVSGFLLSPARKVDEAIDGMSTSGLPVSAVRKYRTGSVGTVKCGTASVSLIDLTVCVWGDHGSLGLVLFYDRQVAESADLLLKIRDEMVKRRRVGPFALQLSRKASTPVHV
jgi:hypothetical protein